jgi:dihydroxyacetone kinase-like predicted kinase
MVNEDSAIITVIYGSDVKDDEAKKLASRLEKDYPDCDIDLRSGLQPVYSYLIGVE